MLARDSRKVIEKVHSRDLEADQDSVISFHTQVPGSLKEAMNGFIERYPNWDQYRLIQAALSGFLVQNGITSREITRLYIGNMFDSNSLLKGNQ